MAKVSVVDITKSLKGMEFPADKEDLIDHARDNGADEEVLEMMEEMPGEEYATIAEVMHAWGEVSREDKTED